MTKLSILIPTLESRKGFFSRIHYKLSWLQDQLPNPSDVELVICLDNGEMTTGEKRNWCVQNADGEYIAFVDDDDDVTDVYLKKQMEVVNSGADCGSLIGLYFQNGKYDRPFVHSKEYTIADLSPPDQTMNGVRFYRRAPNHLNCIKRDLVKDIPFQHKNFGEDGCWMEDILKSGRIKTEYKMDETIYLYYARSK